VVIIQGVRMRLQNRGLGAVMIHLVLSALKEAGYDRVGITWIADVNIASMRGALRGGARPLHRLHLYKKRLTA
ncbi:MAG: GNAT family N-acetyltransferase, partial [Gaiellaceae bacterium]